MKTLNRILRRTDPRDGEVCTHPTHIHAEGHSHTTVGGATFDYCPTCGARWHWAGSMDDSKPGPYVRRNWKWREA